MIRRLVIAVALAAALGAVNAPAASALPVDTVQARWACVAVFPTDTGLCVSGPS